MESKSCSSMTVLNQIEKHQGYKNIQNSEDLRSMKSLTGMEHHLLVAYYH